MITYEECVQKYELLGLFVGQRDKEFVKEVIDACKEDEELLFAVRQYKTPYIFTNQRIVYIDYSLDEDPALADTHEVLYKDITRIETQDFLWVKAWNIYIGSSIALMIEPDVNKTKFREFDVRFQKRWQEVKQENSKPIMITSVSNADEIKKFKELCDAGIITQEEFEKKKKQLLGE